VQALEEVVSRLPGDLAAAVLVVLHLSPKHKSLLPQILAAAGLLPAAAAEDGEALQRGRIYIASPDTHLLVDRDRVKVSKGPKENHFRPSVDVLFRSAAYHFGSRVVGVVLSGSLSDGSSGLFAIRRLGGIAIVQEPSEALYSSMPLNALRRVDIDYSLPVAQMGALLGELVQQPPRDEPAGSAQYRRDLKFEVDVSASDSAFERGIMEFGQPSNYTCPDCHGVLFRIREGKTDRFRCHTGHGFSSQALLDQLAESVEENLWTAVRSVQETLALLTEAAAKLTDSGDSDAAAALKEKADEVEKRLDSLRTLALDDAGLRGAPAGDAG
jgi:two-component system chemotaxis response regulator CheB